jgi:magnesium-transporting ATPase (P-type)
MTKTPQQQEKSLKLMRSVVINMGILLIVGTLALFVAVIMKANSSPEEQQPVEVIQSTSGKCTQYPATDLSVIGNIISSDNNNGILTITTTKQVLIFDICKGKVVAKFSSKIN